MINPKASKSEATENSEYKVFEVNILLCGWTAIGENSLVRFSFLPSPPFGGAMLSLIVETLSTGV